MPILTNIRDGHVHMDAKEKATLFAIKEIKPKEQPLMQFSQWKPPEVGLVFRQNLFSRPHLLHEELFDYP